MPRTMGSSSLQRGAYRRRAGRRRGKFLFCIYLDIATVIYQDQCQKGLEVLSGLAYFWTKRKDFYEILS